MAAVVNFEAFQATREVAEGVVKRAMTPLRKVIDEYKEEPDGSVTVSVSLHDIRSVDADLGIIGSILATQYGKEKVFQDTLKEFAEENVRLHAAVDVLSHHLVERDETIEAVVKQRNDAETVNIKLRELTDTTGKIVEPSKPTFKKPELV